MAKENSFTGIGLVTGKKVIWKQKDEKTRPYSVRYTVVFVRRPNVSGYVRFGKLRDDEVLVYAQSNDILPNGYAVTQHMAKDADVGDVVFVTGTISSRDVKPSSICPKCRKKNTIESSIIYIDPTFVMPVRRAKSNVDVSNIELPEEAEAIAKAVSDYNSILGKKLRKVYMDLLRSNSVGAALDEDGAKNFVRGAHEASNRWYGVMSLLGDPRVQLSSETSGTLHSLCAINRLRHIYSDPSDKMTDYVQLAMYGPRAAEFSKILKYQSTIYVGASINSRKQIRKCTCAHCGYEYQMELRTSEIVPYHVEFIKDCVIPASIVSQVNDYEDSVAQAIEDAKKSGGTVDYDKIIDVFRESEHGGDDAHSNT